MRILQHDQMVRLQEAVVAAQLTINRTALLIGISPEFAASIPNCSTSSAQILTDLDTMNDVGILADGSFPLQLWLTNAVTLSGPRTETTIFRDGLNKCLSFITENTLRSTAIAESHSDAIRTAVASSANGLKLLVAFLHDSGVPDDMCVTIVQTLRDDGVETLLPIQVHAIETIRTSPRSQNLVIVAPTSSGKTFFGELMSLICALRQTKLYYLVPFKALAEEKGERFTRLYGREEIGVRTVVCTGDRKDSDIDLLAGTFDIAVLTYEKFANLLVTRPGLLRDAGGIVIDEVQMLADESRGAALEILLTSLRRLRPDVQIVCLSAVVSDLNNFDTWLNATVVRDETRPIPLREGVISPGRDFQFIVRGPTSIVQQEKLSSGSAPILSLVDLAVELLMRNEFLLVFAETVPRSKEIAEQIALRCASLRPATATIQRLADLEQLEVTQQLSKTLLHGISFHNADLPLEERLIIESAFRDGDVQCVVSTSTLAMGVNLFASTVIISSTQKPVNVAGSWGKQPIPIADYRNMAGRAGRFGKRAATFGRSIIWADTRIQESGVMRDYVHGDTEPMRSVLLNRSSGKQILSIIATMGRLTWSDMSELFRSSYAASAGSPEVVAIWLSDVENALENVRAMNLATNRDGMFELTDLGRVCATSGLDIETFQGVLELASKRHVSAGTIAVIACQSRDIGPEQSNIRLTRRDAKTRWHDELSTYASIDGSPLLADYIATIAGGTNEISLVRAKYLLLAFSYVSGIDSGHIERAYSVSMARVKVVGLNCARLCDALALVYVAQGQLHLVEQAERLAERYRVGGSEATLFLSQTGRTLHRSEREKIVQSGFTTSEALLEATAEDVARIARVGRGRVAATQKSIRALMGVALGAEREQMSRLAALREDPSPILALYRERTNALEAAIVELLCQPFVALSITRSADQDEGESDLIIRFDDGYTGVARVTAKERDFDRVGPTKAGAVLQQSPELLPQLFLCFGRPDFDAISVRKAHALAQRYNYKLIPVFVLAELYVRWKEGRVSSEKIVDLLRNHRGYVALETLNTASTA